MSRFSGKCDLYDHIAGQGGWFDKDGHSVKLGDPNVHCYYSDELLDFEAFKKKTGGKIYQHHKINVDTYNQDFVKEHCPGFNYVEHKEQRPNKATKTGFKDYVYYTYTYYNKEYSLKELNQHGVWIELPIYFDNLLDLIPYYPYLVTLSCCSNSEEHVVISKQSFTKSEFESHLQSGYISLINYDKELQQHYLEVCKEYFLKDIDQRTKQISLIGYKPLHNGYYELLLNTAADYMHPVKFIWKDGKTHTHWTSPKLQDPYTILVSEQDIEYYLADDIKTNNISIEYVEKGSFNINLN